MHTAAADADRTNDAAPPAHVSYCPACNGPLIPLRDAYRCSRCFLTLCVGCDAADGPDQGAGG